MKPKSQIRKIGDQIILSSAYSTASNLVNLNPSSGKYNMS